jgi:hypothetical protein
MSLRRQAPRSAAKIEGYQNPDVSVCSLNGQDTCRLQFALRLFQLRVSRKRTDQDTCMVLIPRLDLRAKSFVFE